MVMLNKGRGRTTTDGDYRWKELLKPGERLTFSQGKHYTCSTEAFIGRIRRAASYHKVSARILPSEDRLSVTVVIQESPKKETIIATS